MLAEDRHTVRAELRGEFLVDAPRHRPQQFGCVAFHIAQVAHLPVRHPRMIELTALGIQYGQCGDKERVVLQPELLQVGGEPPPGFHDACEQMVRGDEAPRVVQIMLGGIPQFEDHLRQQAERPEPGFLACPALVLADPIGSPREIGIRKHSAELKLADREFAVGDLERDLREPVTNDREISRRL